MGLFKRKSKKVKITGSANQMTLHKNLDFTAIEQYKLLRANLKFTIPEGVKCPVIGVTSSIRGEGKSTTAINISYVLAEQGGKVLIVDGDLRLPSIAKKMDLPGEPGVTNMLMGGEINYDDYRTELLNNWYIIPSGPIPPNPSELLASGRMENLLNKFREYFDYIIIDLPPVNIVSDAMAISSYITGMVVVVRENYTEKRELEQCIRQLNLANVNVLGCVLNESGGEGGKYSKYSKYGKYGKYGKGRYYKYYKREPYSMEAAD